MKRKYLFIITGYLVSTIILLWMVQSSLQHFSSIEQDETVEDLLQAQSILGSDVQQMITTAGDYAGWDDTYKYVLNHNRDYIVNSLGDSFYTKLRLNIFYIVNNNGTIIYSRFMDKYSIDGSAFPVLTNRKIVSAGIHLMKTGSTGNGGLLLLDEGLMMVAASPVLTTEQKGPVRGTVILGRMLDAAEIKRTGSKIKMDISITSSEYPEKIFNGKKYSKKTEDGQPVAVGLVNSEKVSSFTTLKDIYGNDICRLRLDKPRNTYRQAYHATMQLAFFCFIILNLVTLVIVQFTRKLSFITVRENNANMQLKAFVELAVDGIFKIDLQWKIVEANLQAAAITGYKCNELTGMHFCKLFRCDNTSAPVFKTEHLDTGLCVTSRQQLLRREETCVEVEIRCKRLPDGYYQCVMQDLTERLHWEEMLHHQQELLNGIINGAEDFIYAKDINGCYLLINNTGLDFIGRKQQEIKGLSDYDIYPAKTAELVSEMDRPVLSDGSTTTTEDIIERHDGNETIFLSTRSPLFDRDGNIKGMFAILHDITVRTMLEKELLEQHNKLGQMAIKVTLAEERERVRIAEELHDQVGPNLLLSKMKLNMLQSRLSEQACISIAEDVESLIEQAVKDIRSLTMQLRPPILANAGLEAAIKWLVHEFAEKYKLQVTLNDDRKVKPLKYEKRTILFQAVRELLINITKHAGVAAAELDLVRAGNLFRITVTDNGSGFRHRNETASSMSGGFGLFNITRKIQHIKGNLSVVSSPGNGTKVILEVPVDID